MMSREQRRVYARRIKKDKRASKCPKCGYLSLFYSEPKLKYYEGTKSEFKPEDFDVVVKCEVCGAEVLAGEAVSKLIKPGIYLPLPLDVFQLAFKYENEYPDEKEELNE